MSTNSGPNGTRNVNAHNTNAPTNGNLAPYDGNNTNALTNQNLTPNDGNNTNPLGPQVPLTAINLAELNQQRENYVQPPATVNERLAQARNFLSDEDINLCREFTEYHQQIDDILRGLSEGKQVCDVGLYKQVQDMTRVHQTRMDKLKYPIAKQVSPSLLASYSSRLPSNDPTAIAEAHLAFRKDDHAPFTINRKPDHAEFVHAFRTNDETGRKLRNIEHQAYLGTLSRPKLVNTYVEENSFEQRALKRGRRRAALQVALRTFAENREQHFSGGWMHRVVSLPQPPVVTLDEPRMCQAALESERSAEPDAYEWTKKNFGFQQGQKQLEQWVNTERAEVQGSTITPNDKSMLFSEPAVFYKPTQRRGVVKARQERRLIRLARVTFALVARAGLSDVSRATGGDAPSTHEALVFIRAIQEGLIDGGTNETQDVPTATQITMIQQYAKSGGQLLQIGSDGGNGDSALSDSELARLEACPEEGLSEPNGETTDFLRRLRIELFNLIEQSENVDSEDNSQMTEDQDRQALVNFREDLARDTSTTTTARKFFTLQELAEPLNGTDGLPDIDRAKSLLTDKILTENHEDVRSRKLQHNKVWSFSSKLPARSKARNFFSLEKWSAPPPFVPTTAAQETTGKRKASIAPETAPGPKRLRKETTAAQTTGGKRKATSDPETAPAPKRSQNAVDYRSLDPNDTNPSRRLAPEEIGFQVVKEKSHEPVLEVGSGKLMPPEIKNFNFKRHGQVLENAPDPVEKRLKGPPKFPFGETSATSAAMTTQIGLHLRDGKRSLSTSVLMEDNTDDSNHC